MSRLRARRGGSPADGIPAVPSTVAPSPVPPPSDDTAVRKIVAAAFGRTVRAARRAHGITQESLAQRAQLDRTYPSLLERGLRTPTLTSLFAISGALNLHPSALLENAWRAYRGLESAAPTGDPPVGTNTITSNAPLPKGS